MTQTFIGYIAQDITELNKGAKAFTLAYNPVGKDKEAIFIRCTMFKDIVASNVNIIKYLKKGSSVIVSGNISENSVYQTKTGEYKAGLKVIVYAITFMPKSSNSFGSKENKLGLSETNSSIDEALSKVIF